MNILGNKTVGGQGFDNTVTLEQERTALKIRNASMKKFYESKIISLSDRSMTPRLLKIMCQDVPVKAENLESKWSRTWFIRKCLRYYRNKLRQIERSEKSWFFSLFS